MNARVLRINERELQLNLMRLPIPWAHVNKHDKLSRRDKRFWELFDRQVRKLHNHGTPLSLENNVTCSVADQGERPHPPTPLIFRPNWVLKARKNVSGPAPGRTYERRMKSLWHPGYFSLARPRKCCPYNTHIIQGTPHGILFYILNGISTSADKNLTKNRYHKILTVLSNGATEQYMKR